MSELEEDGFLEKLILDGAVQFAGLDENGEMLYNFTPKLEETDPDFHKKVMEGVYHDIQQLWIAGFVDIQGLDGAEPICKITEKALDDDLLAELDPYYQRLIHLIKEYTKLDN